MLRKLLLLMIMGLGACSMAGSGERTLYERLGVTRGIGRIVPGFTSGIHGTARCLGHSATGFLGFFAHGAHGFRS